MLPLNWKGTAVWSGVTALATWLASGPAVAPGAVAGAPVRPARPALTDGAASVQPLVDLTGEAERLARRLDEAQVYRAPARDPFQFKVAAEPARPVAAVAAPVAPASLTPAPVAPPTFMLVGVAEDRQGDGVIRTAVVSGGGELWLVKAGESVDGKFTVTAVDADAVELIRADTGTAVRLTFRP